MVFIGEHSPVATEGIMKIERIQYSLTSATREISRYAATRRFTAAADLTKDEAGYHHHKPEQEDDEDVEEPVVATAAGLQAQVRLLNITA
jgi:hypothetical protein